MQVSKAAKRYAQVLFDLASEGGQAERMNDVMEALSPMLTTHSGLSSFLNNYTLPAAARMGILSDLFEKRCGELFWKFIRFLEAKRRTGLLGHIAISYSQIYMRKNGIADAFIKVPFALEEAQKASVKNYLEKKTAGRVSLHAGCDTSLIGGFTILMDWKLYDLSVSGMLESLRRNSLNT